MLPSNFVFQLQQKNAKSSRIVPTPSSMREVQQSNSPEKSPAILKEEIDDDYDEDIKKEDLTLSPGSDGLRRKPCNCTRSMCLKLYCDCFANGEFCSNCNCKECFNNLENEEERQKAIRTTLDRNPNAFR